MYSLMIEKSADFSLSPPDQGKAFWSSQEGAQSPGQVAKLVKVLSPYTKVTGLIQESTSEYINHCNNKSMFNIFQR